MKTIKILLITVFSIIGCIYLYFEAVDPIITVNKLNSDVLKDSVYIKKHQNMADFPKLLPQIKEKAFIDAQLSLAKRDSIGLVINLKDSTLNLVMKGVTIRKSKMYGYKKDRIFDGFNGPAYYKYFSKPLSNVKEYCSLVKEPIEYKKAPKDTLEALKHLTIPDSVACEPAYYSIDLDNGFKLIMVQPEWETEAEKEVGKKYNKDMFNQRFFLKRAVNLLKKEKQDYQPTLVLKVSKYDIRALYRGLPWKQGIVINY